MRFNSLENSLFSFSLSPRILSRRKNRTLGARSLTRLSKSNFGLKELKKIRKNVPRPCAYIAPQAEELRCWSSGSDHQSGPHVFDHARSGQNPLLGTKKNIRFAKKRMKLKAEIMK